MNKKQERFCHEYIIDLNATQAAIRAGYKSENANAQSSKLLTKANIQKKISELQAERAERTRITADYVLNRLKEIDELDIIDIFNDNFTELKPVKEWPKAWRTSISGVDIKRIMAVDENPAEMFLTKIKLPDKVKNLELLSKHVGVGNVFDHEATHSDQGKQIIAAAGKGQLSIEQGKELISLIERSVKLTNETELAKEIEMELEKEEAQQDER